MDYSCDVEDPKDTASHTVAPGNEVSGAPPAAGWWRVREGMNPDFTMSGGSQEETVASAGAPAGLLFGQGSSRLSRQWSFDDGGEERLSSTQVKQRLKECLLTRRMRLALQRGSQSSSIESECSSPGGLSNHGAEQVMRSYPLPSITGGGSGNSRTRMARFTDTSGASGGSSMEEAPTNSGGGGGPDEAGSDPNGRIRKTSSEPNLFKAKSTMKRKVTLHSRSMRYPNKSPGHPSSQAQHVTVQPLSPAMAQGPPQLPQQKMMVQERTQSGPPPQVAPPLAPMAMFPVAPMMMPGAPGSILHGFPNPSSMCYTTSMPSLNSIGAGSPGMIPPGTDLAAGARFMPPYFYAPGLGLIPTEAAAVGGVAGHPGFSPMGLVNPAPNVPLDMAAAMQHSQRTLLRNKMRQMRQVVSDECPPVLDDPRLNGYADDAGSSTRTNSEDHYSGGSSDDVTPLSPPTLVPQSTPPPSQGSPSTSGPSTGFLRVPSSGRTTLSAPGMELPSPIEEEEPRGHGIGVGLRSGQADEECEPNSTGLAYDADMLLHRCCCPLGDSGDVHPENPARLRAVWARLVERGLVDHCKVIRARRASMEELKLVHSEEYAVVLGTNAEFRARLDSHVLARAARFCHLLCGGIGFDSDTVWNDLTTSQAARLAVGQVLNLAIRVVQNKLRNGFAIVRPPGHHAEASQSLGFCYFNSVAIAARAILTMGLASRILIVDWDVHHGNGTQAAFLDDPRVVYMSLHRHDGGAFFPGTGTSEEVGRPAALGRTINIAWERQVGREDGGDRTSPTDLHSSNGTHRPGETSDQDQGAISDAEYLSAFRNIILPVAAEFDPQLVLVSAGFDAAAGHADCLGGYNVSPAAFAWMTRQLMRLAGGRLVLALEGGYNPTSLCDCVESCLRALIAPPPWPSDADDLQSSTDDPAHSWHLPPGEVLRRPSTAAILSLARVVRMQRPYWACLRTLEEGELGKSHAETLPQSNALTNMLAGLRVDNQ